MGHPGTDVLPEAVRASFYALQQFIPRGVSFAVREFFSVPSVGGPLGERFSVQPSVKLSGIRIRLAIPFP